MAAANTNALDYLGKYVSFNHDDIFDLWSYLYCNFQYGRHH